MDSDILNIEEIVLGRALPNQAPAPPPEKPVEPFRAPISLNGPAVPTAQSYQHENLQCFQCFITFCNAKAKERHMKKSHREEYKQQLAQGNTLFTCYVCDRTFLSSEELTLHQPTHSKDDKPFKCAPCKESFRTFTELTTHRRHVCPEKLLPCKDCSKTFRSAAMLRTHRLVHHARPDGETAEQPEEPASSHRCKKCGQVFPGETELTEHEQKYPDGQQCNGGEPPAKKRGRQVKTEEVAAPEKRGKRKKKDEVESFEEGEVAQVVEKPKTGGAKRGRPPKVVKCETDDKESPPADGDEATKGLKIKAEPAEPAAPAQHTCPDCELLFPSALQLRSHKKEKHAARKAHRCSECDESFARAEQLEAHVSRAHVLGRFACPTCGKSFGRERTLKAHQKSHPEEQPETPKR
ncbi:zinc finger protein 576.2 [Stigmatopora nigra]